MNRTPRTASELRTQANGLRRVANRLGTTLLAPFLRADLVFNHEIATPEQRDQAWAFRTEMVTQIRAAENCTPIELRKGIEGLRTKADRLDSQASELESTTLLENIVGRKLGPPKAKVVQYDRSGRKLAA